MRYEQLRNVLTNVQAGIACGARSPNGTVQLRMNNVTTSGAVDFTNHIRIPSEIVSSELLLRTGDVVFNNTNSVELVGKTALFEGFKEPVTYSNHFTRLRTTPEQLEPAYLTLWLQWLWSQKKFEAICDRWIGQAAVQRAKIEALEIALPPIHKQRRIAARLKAQLDAVEEARKAVEAQVKKVAVLEEAFLRDIEARLFGVFETDSFARWVLSYRNGFGRRPKPGELGPIVLRIADVSSGVIDLSAPRRGEVSDKELATYRLEVGDLLFVRVNGTREIVGRCCVVDDSLPNNTIFNDHLIRVKLHKDLLPDFAKLCMSLPLSRKVLEKAASTSAGQLTVNQDILDSIFVPVVPVEKQMDIVRQYQEQVDSLTDLRASVRARREDIECLPSRLLAQAFGEA